MLLLGGAAVGLRLDPNGFAVNIAAGLVIPVEPLADQPRWGSGRDVARQADRQGVKMPPFSRGQLPRYVLVPTKRAAAARRAVADVDRFLELLREADRPHGHFFDLF